MNDRWYSYECMNPECPTSFLNGKTGVVLDIRLPGGEVPYGDEPSFKIPCPMCREPMRWGAHWEATEAGYGSRGDSSVRRFEIIELLRQIDERIGYWLLKAFDQPEHRLQGTDLSLVIEEMLSRLEQPECPVEAEATTSEQVAKLEAETTRLASVHRAELREQMEATGEMVRLAEERRNRCNDLTDEVARLRAQATRLIAEVQSFVQDCKDEEHNNWQTCADWAIEALKE